tara:strand:- start:117 stop:902 length:786 start_codon:yes stop_codon:yes gene_type:complete
MSSEKIDRDAWLAWQIEFTQKLRRDSMICGWSFDFLQNSFDREFPRAYKAYIVGMKRAGNHAIINWMIQNCSESHVFFNNMATLDVDLVKVYNAEYVTARLMDRVICSFEHISLDFCDTDDKSVWYIARDPYNWLASWVSHTHCNLGSLESDVQVYIDNIKKSKSKILYNEWFKSVEYRNSLADKLGFRNNDIGIDDVVNFGKGSSFDKKTFNGQGSSMDVLRRWQKCVDNPVYMHLVRNYYDEFEKIANDEFDMKCPVSI